MSILFDALRNAEDMRNRDKVQLLPASGQAVMAAQPSSPAMAPPRTVAQSQPIPWVSIILGLVVIVLILSMVFLFILDHQKDQTRMLLQQNLFQQQQQNIVDIAKSSGQLTTTDSESSTLSRQLLETIQLNMLAQQTRQSFLDETARISNSGSSDDMTNITPDTMAFLHQPVSEQVIVDENGQTTIQPVATEENAYNAQVLDKAKVHVFEQLPTDLAADWPAMNYNAHLYTPTPKDARLLIINDQQFKEGDTIDSNLSVEEITERGALFNFKGYKVTMDIVSQIN